MKGGASMKPLFLQILIMLSSIFLYCTFDENTKISQESNLLGDRSQISLSCIDIKKSLEFYKKLNFSLLEVQLNTDIPWALLSDGSQLFMLSQNEFPSPTLTFYGKSLSERIKKLELLGLDLEIIPDQQGQIKSAILKTPGKIGVSLINFNTSILPKPKGHPEFPLGKFTGFYIPVSNLNKELIFWENAGFKTMAKWVAPTLKVSLEQANLRVLLLQDRTFAEPAICYTHQDEKSILNSLKDAKIAFEVRQSDAKSWVFFESPDTQLFLIEVPIQ